MKSFKEWLLGKQEKNLTEICNDMFLFDSFNTHSEIEKIYTENNSVNFIFSINNFMYKIFVDHYEDERLHLGFSRKHPFFSNQWDNDKF